MSKPAAPACIRIRGARQNNLKNLDLDLPFRKLVVVTGLSGSGKSSLAFDTLFAEGQRRYVETFSPYARQFFDRMDKPAVDSIEGIPPAIAIEQRNAVRSTRSTVGTMTEVCDYMKVLWPHVSTLYCRQCGQPVRKDSPQTIWEGLTKPMPDAGYRMPDEGSSLYAAMELRDHPSALSDPESSIRDQGSGIRHPASAPHEALITFHLPLSDKLSVAEQLALVAKQGFQRLWIDGKPVRIEDAAALIGHPESGIRDRARNGIDVLQDRIKLVPVNRSRFTEACEQAFHFGHGKLTVHLLEPGTHVPPATRHPLLFSNRFHCAACDLDYREPSAALFSFNHPVGACPECKGFGRIITIDYNLAIPDRSKTLADGAVKPWQTETGKECQTDMLNFAGRRKVPLNVPFRDLPEKWQRWVMDGDPDYGKDEDHKWPHLWYGVKGYFRWLESKAYKMHVRVLLSRYRAYTQCPTCQGQRFQPDALLFRLPIENPSPGLRPPSPRPAGRGPVEGPTANIRTDSPVQSDAAPETAVRKSKIGNHKSQITLSDFYLLPVRDALAIVDHLAEKHRAAANDPLSLALQEVRARLGYLDEVGLGYLTLDRATRTLSGGETARVNLTSCLGSRLVNTLFVLDEPSVGLHPRDTDRLVKVLHRLRDQGNTVVVVEHESNVMRAADQIIDLGPGHGESGGDLVFQGTLEEMLAPEGRTSMPGKSREKGKNKLPAKEARPASSLTADYLTGRKSAAQPKHRPVSGQPGVPRLTLAHATRHNLRDVTLDIPLRSFVCVSGVSGSGKSTLIRDILLPLLEEKLGRTDDAPAASESEKEDENDSEATVTDATLTGHEALGRVVLVDQSPLGRTPRSNPAVYIGAFEDLRDLFAQTELAKQRGLNASAFSFNSGQGQCERCRGAGFEKIEMQFLSDVFVRCPDCDGRRYRGHILEVKLSSGPASGIGYPASREWSIADLLDATVDDAVSFLDSLPASKPATRARKSLALLQDIGLGYLRLGQPINTLSGGESQRLKLVRHLAEFSERASQSEKPSLFLFDEPTTGLHFEDVRILVGVFQRIVDAGHSVLVIEHNLDVIRSADWVIDLGPDAGDEGGTVVATGTPDQLMAVAESRTGEALREHRA